MTELREIRARRQDQAPEGFMKARGLAIAVVVLVAGAAFILGYFVGRATAPVQTAADSSGISADTFRGGVVVSPANPSPDISNEPTVPAKPLSLRPASEEPAATKEDTAATVSEKPSAAKPSDKKPAHQSVGAKPSDKKPAQKPAAAPAAKGPVYSVQIGALSAQGEASALKKKFASKGYDTYIVKEAAAGGKAVYKVRVGPFKDKESANRIALRIKASEGLTVFVSEGQ